MVSGMFTRVFLLLLPLVVLAAEPEVSMQQAESLLNQGHSDKAAEQYRQLIKSDANNLNARNNLGLILMLQGRISAATEAFREILALNPKDVRARNNLALCFLKQGDATKAVNELAIVTDQAPDFVEAHINYAEALITTGELNRAQELLQGLLVKDFRQLTVHYHLGNIASRRGNHRQALQHYQQALRLNSGHVQSLVQAGFSQLSLGNGEQATALLAHANSRAPENPLIYHGLGLSALQLGQIQDSIDALNYSLKLRPGNDQVHTHLAMANENSGDYDAEADAEQHYRRALMLNPKNLTALYGLAFLLESQVRQEEAIIYYKRLLQEDANHVDAMKRMGELHLRRGEVKEALDYLQRLQAMTPDDEGVQLSLAEALLADKQVGEAMNLVRKALASTDDQYLFQRAKEILQGYRSAQQQ